MPELVITDNSGAEVLRLNTDQTVHCDLVKRKVNGDIVDSCQVEMILQNPAVLEPLVGLAGATVILSDGRGISRQLIDAEQAEYYVSVGRTSGVLNERITFNGNLG